MIKYFCDCCEIELNDTENFLLTLNELYGQKTQEMFHLCPECALNFRKDIKDIFNKYSKGE